MPSSALINLNIQIEILIPDWSCTKCLGYRSIALSIKSSSLSIKPERESLSSSVIFCSTRDINKSDDDRQQWYNGRSHDLCHGVQWKVIFNYFDHSFIIWICLISRLPDPQRNAGMSWEELLEILEWQKNDIADNSRWKYVKNIRIYLNNSIEDCPMVPRLLWQCSTVW